jgi:hypothetical protein
MGGMRRVQFRLRHIFIATAVVAVCVNLALIVGGLGGPSVFAPLVGACGFIFVFGLGIYFVSWLILWCGDRLP